MRRLVICLVLLTAVPGCVSVDAYPEDWGKIVDTHDACPLLTGSYNNIGVRSGHQNSSSYSDYELSQFLFRENVGRADRIDLDFGADRVLRVRALFKGDIVSETAFSERDSTLVCDESGIRINVYKGPIERHEEGRGGGGPGVLGYASDYDELSKAEDGALIIRRSFAGAGVAYYVVPFPLAGAQIIWMRFPPFDAVK